ncbi:MAG: SH3 domain-containing protein [Desulfobacterales bacterium]|nr:SH3 domain-containing protein [Desulfobacterales bacterium]MDX2511603.1 SH3 domain-containing protein [Desulfobacterales bacterium]
MRYISFLTIVVILLTGSFAMAERLSVSSKIANIRSGPGTGYEILWKVESYYPISVLKKSGSWINFRDFEGDEGWIHTSLVQKKPTVITVKNKCNVRTGPGTSHEVIFTVEKGIPFLIVNRQKSWIQIKHADGDRGWRHKSLVW